MQSHRSPSRGYEAEGVDMIRNADQFSITSPNRSLEPPAAQAPFNLIFAVENHAINIEKQKHVGLQNPDQDIRF
jgi:hypothetical protein